MYLAAAGIGAIDIWDDDHVDRSNLQRQVQFGEPDIDQPKAELLAERLRAQNKALSVTAHTARFEAGATPSGNILIDATDNYQARFALNALAHKTARPMIHGAAARWTGQVSVFASGLEGAAPCYQCWVPEEPPAPEACEDVGVAGPVTGIVATHMALETLKLITGAGRTLTGKLLLFDGLSGVSRQIALRKDLACPICS
ncbi:MAG: HesA/MoeB/ThiF family protein [Pseudomonadota bacterium]